MIVGRRISLHSVASSVRRANLIFLFWALVVTILNRRTSLENLSIASAPLTILGAALTIFLAFRTNSAYDRWWEARTLWGGIVNQSRTLVRQLLSFTGSAPGAPAGDDVATHPLVREMAYRQIALVNAMRAHLRGQDAAEAACPFLTDGRVEGDGEAEVEALRKAPNVPDALLATMGKRLRLAHRDGLLDTIQLAALDGTLTELTNLLGGCERIKNTPLPRQYDTVPQIAIVAFGLVLPLGLVDAVGWWTPLLSVLIVSLFIAIDTIGSNIEDPFESTIHDTPMSALCRTIEVNLRYTIGEREGLPEPAQPRRGVLM